jgi:hypothetical protein
MPESYDDDDKKGGPYIDIIQSEEYYILECTTA